MAINEIYNIVRPIEKVDSITKNINSIQEILSGNEELSELTYDELNSLVYVCEKVALSARNAIEKYGKTEEINSTTDEYDFKTNPVKVKLNDNILQIKCPFTFKRFYKKQNIKENYLFMNYIKSALKTWAKMNKKDLKTLFKNQLSVLIIRTGNHYNRTKICDNDNLENGRIINEIFDAIGYSDNAKQMDLYSCFRENSNTKEYGMTFIVCNRSDFYKIINHLNSNNPG